MSKLNDNSQDEVRPENSALDDIPFAIEVNEDEEAAVVVGSDDDESVAASDVADTTAGTVADDGEGAVQGEEMEDEAAAEEGLEGSTQKKRSSRSKNARSKVSFEPPLSLREILFGDFLLGTFLRRQVWFILFLVVLSIFYISNRYAAQQEIIEEETLQGTGGEEELRPHTVCRTDDGQQAEWTGRTSAFLRRLVAHHVQRTAVRDSN